MAGEGREKRVVLGRYELGRVLGRGSSGKVHVARDLSSGKSAAVKCISRERIQRSGQAANVEREISILRRLRHPHIVRLREVLATRSTIYLAMDLAKGGELFSKLAAGRLPEDLSRRYFHQLISAVGYCHARGVFHRDLKLENLLLDEKGDLKLADFGLGAARPAGPLRTVCGTPAYVAPEVLTGGPYAGGSADLWSCGVVLFALAAGYLPFNGLNLMAMYKKIIAGRFRAPGWFSPGLARLLTRLLDPDPGSRITVQGIALDPWFRAGLDESAWAAMTAAGDEPLAKPEAPPPADANAFSIIGFDLAGLFEPRPRWARAVARGPVDAALVAVVVAVDGPGVEVRRDAPGRVVVRGPGGVLVAVVGASRLAAGLVLVEAEMGQGPAPGLEGFWDERVLPVMSRLRADC
ncbi:CBL-interacting serine/threonine-protein kinase 14-like [Wolffia australiana]